MPKPKITLFVDIVSPFAYIGYWALRNISVFKQCDIEYVPVFLGGLMRNCGNTAPIFIKNKDKWINVERRRWASYLNVPIKKEAPPNFPPNTIAVQRALAAIQLHKPALLPTALDALFPALWVQHEEIKDPKTVAAVLESAIGAADAKAAIEGAQSAGAKKQLTDNTDAAFAAGAFGLPWFVCTNAEGETEGFWGVDHLAQVVDFLGLERPVDHGFRALL